MNEKKKEQINVNQGISVVCFRDAHLQYCFVSKLLLIFPVFLMSKCHSC